MKIEVFKKLVSKKKCSRSKTTIFNIEWKKPIQKAN
jgi:hypothetical protein